MRKIIIIEEDSADSNAPIVRRENPLVDGWICPYCGKRVYSMEVHQCHQPYCGVNYD